MALVCSVVFLHVIFISLLLFIIILLLLWVQWKCCCARQWISIHHRCLTGSRLLKAVILTFDCSTEVSVYVPKLWRAFRLIWRWCQINVTLYVTLLTTNVCIEENVQKIVQKLAAQKYVLKSNLSKNSPASLNQYRREWFA